MNNLFFKSRTGLIKNSSINIGYLSRQLEMLLKEQRHQRADLATISRKIDRLLIDKHLQMQVDEYFTETSPQTESEEQE